MGQKCCQSPATNVWARGGNRLNLAEALRCWHGVCLLARVRFDGFSNVAGFEDWNEKLLRETEVFMKNGHAASRPSQDERVDRLVALLDGLTPFRDETGTVCCYFRCKSGESAVFQLRDMAVVERIFYLYRRQYNSAPTERDVHTAISIVSGGLPWIASESSANVRDVTTEIFCALFRRKDSWIGTAGEALAAIASELRENAWPEAYTKIIPASADGMGLWLKHHVAVLRLHGLVVRRLSRTSSQRRWMIERLPSASDTCGICQTQRNVSVSSDAMPTDAHLLENDARDTSFGQFFNS